MSTPFKRAELCCTTLAEVCLSQIQILCVEEHTPKLQKKAVWKILSTPLLWNERDEELGEWGWGACPCILVICYSCENPWRPSLVSTFLKKSHAFKNVRQMPVIMSFVNFLVLNPTGLFMISVYRTRSTLWRAVRTITILIMHSFLV